MDLTCETGGDRTLLNQIGLYSISAHYVIEEGLPCGPLDLAWEAVEIMVSQPTGPDLAAYELLQSGAKTKTGGLWNAYREQAETYEALLSECPGSGYAVGAAFYLAQVYACDGEFAHRGLRGTPEGAAALENAAALYLAVAQEAGVTPLAAYSTRLAGACLAKIGKIAEAQNLLEQSFLSPGATDEDRLKALSSMEYAERGGFQRDAGYAGELSPTAHLVPLRRFAEAAGFRVAWEPSTRSVTVESPRMKVGLRVAGQVALLNGRPELTVRARLVDGHVDVSPSLVALLLREHYGRGIERALETLIAQMPSDSVN